MPRPLPPNQRARGVTAVLGPTNTGKTHYAIERMLAHGGGLIGLPLRLLAREVYGRLVERAGAQAVALVTGEEKIKPPNARYWVATVEAMPQDLDLPFVAIDEIQLAADLERGHVFTDRLLNMRGRSETLLIGAETMRPLIEQLIPGCYVTIRPRLSQLTYAGDMKLTRLPRRSAIVAFSAEEVYAVAELIRRQRGGAAVVLGALSPRTRKFDGRRNRWLTPSEFGQIAGRAGRYMRDGTFGTTGRCDDFDPELIDSLENHRFEPLDVLQWRNADLDYRSVAQLIASLEQPPNEAGLEAAPVSEDLLALEYLSRDPQILKTAVGRPGVEKLWGLCQIPDYRRVSPHIHAEMIGTIYKQLIQHGRVKNEWFAARLAEVDRVDGDIDTLSTRIAHVRTWTFMAQRPDWLADPAHWQEVTRRVEDSLSDALHERLTQRFVDRRTSVLMRRLRENAMLEADISATGDVTVEGHVIGRLQGFQFVPDPEAGGTEAKALRATAAKSLMQEFENRAQRVINGVDEAFALAHDGSIRWLGEVIARISAGDKILEPHIRLLADEHLAGGSREQVELRLQNWLKAHIAKLLGPLQVLEAAEGLTGIARGIAFQIAEALGVLDRTKVADDVKVLEQTDRAALRAMGVRFGAYHLTLPALLKPAPRSLAAQLWALKETSGDVHGLDDILHLAHSGRTSIPVDEQVMKELYRAAGFRVCGTRAVRVDILERLADLIRPAIQYRPGLTAGEPPVGTADGDGFVVTTAMTSLCGCAGEDFATILRSLGYVMDRRRGPAITKPLVGLAATEPVTVADAATPEAETPVEASVETPAEQTEEAVVHQAVVHETVVHETAENEQAAAPEPASEPTAESGESGTAAEIAADVAAEPVEIEVWRQQRQHQRPQRDNRQRHQRAGGDSATTPEGESKPRFERQRPKHNKPAQSGEPREGGRAEGGRAEGGRAEGGRSEGGRGAGRYKGGNRTDNGKSRPATGWQDQPRSQARDKAPDPNSPFAKLLALKEQMESKKS
ncbi:MAG: helicase [Hyphomicrobiales bacterium]|nr:helicase [Hyphomicrobiales bacterium]